jgi:GTPase SAR1 family protein
VNGTKGALLVFDLTRINSTFDLESSWLPIIRRENSNLPVLLVGTKKDMIDPSKPIIDPAVPKKILEDNHLQGYIEVSSESGENVEQTFIMLLEKMLGKS